MTYSVEVSFQPDPSPLTCEIELPELVSNSTASNKYNYIVGHRPIAIFFQAYFSSCDAERSVVNSDGSPISEDIFEFNLGGEQDELVIRTDDYYLEGTYNLKYTMYGGKSFPDVYEEFEFVITIQASTCTKKWRFPLVPPTFDSKYVVAADPLKILFNKLDVMNCPFRLDIEDVTDPDYPVPVNSTVFNLVQPQLVENPDDSM